ncbi:Mitochondrial carnitine/acylcarnitine carrier protein CACL [Diplodia seriata]|uniref:Mitochondrial carnitine/acylcarnitine carrier protein CACL n=1 Tax=Diplodia seriata TaxID=420778 RepID=A0A1S8BBT8_9PEZI|nr:Mitochondrial carnitine/acylcarnitine carrier protein CACL [Diplodia seriata]
MSADFWAGYISGAAGIIIGNPLDLVKTRLQAGPAAAAAATRSNAAPAADTVNWRNAGNYVRGATAPILGYGALNAILFVSYNRTLSLLGERDDPSKPHSLARVFWAGAVSGFATFVVSAPTELVKCRAQVYDSMPQRRGGGANGGGSGSGSGRVSSWAVARETWRAEGLKGFYHGGVVTGVRDAVGYAFYFWSYELSKRLITSPDEDTPRQAALKVLLCGGIAGVVTWASIFPLDVIKTRVQTQQAWSAAVTTPPPLQPHRSPALPPGQQSPLLPRESSSTATGSGTVGRRMGAWEVTKHAYRTEGLAPFFRGLGICSVRAFVVNAVQWAVYEWVMQLMREREEREGGGVGLEFAAHQGSSVAA